MTTKKDLHLLSLAALKDAEREKTFKRYFIRTTSGTSGDAPLMMIRGGRAGKEIDFFSGSGAPVFFWGTRTAQLTYLSRRLYSSKKARVLVIMERDLNNELATLLRQYKPDSFCGFPAFLARAILLLQNDGRDVLKRIKTVNAVGEHLNALHQKIIENAVPEARVRCFYASAETGFISRSPCPYLKLNTYHPLKNTRIEILDPDGDGIGELIITTPISASVTLNQYVIGDIGRIVPGKCACGNPITFEILGRKNFDFIKISGATLRQEIFEEAIHKFKDIIKDFRIEAGETMKNNKIMGRLKLYVVLQKKDLSEKEKNNYAAALEKNLPKEILLTPSRTLQNLIKAKKFLPLEIKIADEFPAQHKSVKMKKDDS